MKRCPASDALVRQEAGFTKTGSRTLQISIIVFCPDTIFAKG